MNSIKLREAILNADNRIYGYGVSDTGDRHGGGDESAEYGLCYPRGRPLSLARAIELKLEIGDDACVIAFHENLGPLLVELPADCRELVMRDLSANLPTPKTI